MLNKSSRAAIVAVLGSAALVSGVQADDGAMRSCESGLESPDNSRLNSLQVVGLVGNAAPQRLICFNERRPSAAADIGVVSNLVGDTHLIGIDFRVQDGLLYGVGNAGGLYRIDVTNAVATSVGMLKMSGMPVAPSGNAFGVDFNPAANALRIVSDTGQNLRQSFTVMPLADTAIDTTLSAMGITGAAYTNNDLSTATATTLFDLSSGADNVQIQSPANSGLLAATGSLGVDAAPAAGFDIYSKLRKGVTVDNKGYAVLQADGVAGFYKVDLLTGAAEPKGTLSDNVVDIAIPLNQL